MSKTAVAILAALLGSGSGIIVALLATRDSGRLAHIADRLQKCENDLHARGKECETEIDACQTQREACEDARSVGALDSAQLATCKDELRACTPKFGERSATALTDDEKGPCATLIEEIVGMSGGLPDRKADINPCAAFAEGRLHDVFRNVNRISSGLNKVDKAYVKSLRIDGTTVTANMRVDEPYLNVKPSFTVVFLNWNGVRTGSATFSWLFDTLEPRTTRSRMSRE